MSSTCSEVESSSSGRRLYLQLWCARAYVRWYKQFTLLLTRMFILMQEKRSVS